MFLYGADIRDRLPLPPPDRYARMITEAPRRNLMRLRGRRTLRYPLGYPDPAGEFYGYDVAGRAQHLVVSVRWAATAILVLDAGQYVARKSAWLDLYRRHVGGEWLPFLASVYEQCRNRWGYAIPAGASDRAELRALCRQTLAFENHYLGRYRAYLLGLLADSDPAGHAFALDRLADIIYADAEVAAAVRALAASPLESLRSAAVRAQAVGADYEAT